MSALKNKQYLFFLICHFAFLLLIFNLNDACARVADTQHNLSTSGPGPIKSDTEDQVCIFCHTPHGAGDTPLWNHSLSPPSTTYTVPTGGPGGDFPTMKSAPQNPPDGDSRLCLCCHDGTVAIGSVVNLGGAPTTISIQGPNVDAEGKLTGGASFIGTNLSGHHPVSIEVNDGLIADKNTQCEKNEVSFRICNPGRPVVLRPTNNGYPAGSSGGVGVQCSSCHDAHDNTYGKFLRLPYGGVPWEIDTTPLCTSCHLLCSSGCP